MLSTRHSLCSNCSFGLLLILIYYTLLSIYYISCSSSFFYIYFFYFSFFIYFYLFIFIYIFILLSYIFQLGWKIQVLSTIYVVWIDLFHAAALDSALRALADSSPRRYHPTAGWTATDNCWNLLFLLEDLDHIQWYFNFLVYCCVHFLYIFYYLLCYRITD